MFQDKYPDSPVEIGFPDSLRLLIKSLSMFDPDFARAFRRESVMSKIEYLLAKKEYHEKQLAFAEETVGWTKLTITVES